MKRFSVLMVLFCLPLVLGVPTARAEDTGFTTVRINAFGTAIIRAGQKIGLDVTGIIHTIFNNKEDDIAVPDFEPGADFTKRINEQNTPQHLADEGKIIPAEKDSITYKSLLGIILHTGADHADEVPPTDCFISTGVEETSPIKKAESAFQEAEMIDALWGLFPKDANESGVLDFRLPDKQLNGMNPNEDCKKDIPGVELPPVSNSLTSLSQFGEGTFIESFMNTTIIKETIKIILNGIERTRDQYETEQERNEGILTKKMRQEWHQMLCHIGLCTSRDTGEKTQGLAQTGGAANMFLIERDQYPVEPASVEEYDIAIAGIKQPKKFPQSYMVVNDYYTRLKQVCCSVTPDTTDASYGDLQEKVVLDDAENEIRCKDVCQSEAPAACSTTELPKLSRGSCNICNDKAIKDFADISATVPNGIPSVLMDILGAAGNAYGVPPASILAVMVHEGAFSRDYFKWDDANTTAWSVCGGTIPNCDPKAVDFAACGDGNGGGACATSIAGFGWLPKWFWSGTEGSNANWDAVTKIDPARTKETISPCNVLDAAAATAKSLSRGSVTVPPAVTSPTCFDVPMNNASIPSSCTSWTDQQVFQSHVSYAGYCPKTGENGGYPPNDGYKDMVLGVYNAFNCGSGSTGSKFPQ